MQKEPDNSKEMKRRNFHTGLTFFCVVAACVLFAFLIFKIRTVLYYIGIVFSALKPFVFGLVIAYLVNPITNFIRKYVEIFLAKCMKKKETAGKIANAVGVFGGVIFFLLILFACIYMIIPQFIECIGDMLKVLPGQIENLSKRAVGFFKDNANAGTRISGLLNAAADRVNSWADSFAWADNVATGFGFVTTAVGAVIDFVKNFVIGLFFALYLLFRKDLYIRQTRKVMYACLKKSVVERILAFGKTAHSIFSGFIVGKLIDSLIIGVLCFIGVTVLRMPYAMLVSVIVGVTNVIPVFGPYIGAIPSALLIMLKSPIQGLYFIIFIILLQALDGNFVGPKILGDKIGLSPLWVMFAIVLGGGLFGVFGMLIGVPTFAVLYYLFRTFINDRLRRKELPTASDDYDSDIVSRLNGTFEPTEEETVLPEEPVAEEVQTEEKALAKK